MARYCDFCGNKLGIRKLKYQEGYVCKECYYILSNQFKETIRYKTKEELDKIYAVYQLKYEDIHQEAFEISRRIGNYLLIDDTSKKICLPNNSNIMKKSVKPQIIPFENIKKIQIQCTPNQTNEMIEQKRNNKSKEVVKSLQVELTLIKPGRTTTIVLLNGPVRISSYAFKKSYSFAQRIATTLEQMINDK